MFPLLLGFGEPQNLYSVFFQSIYIYIEIYIFTYMYISTNPHQPCDDFFVNFPLLLLPTHRTPRRIFWATPAGKLAAENKSADKSFEKKTSASNKSLSLLKVFLEKN